MMKLKKTSGSILLISGTCIGAAMIGLPVASAQAGYLGALGLLILCWLMMGYSALLTLEVNLRAPRGANFIRMTKPTLGRMGEVITWVVYLLLLYALMAAYMTAGGHMAQSALQVINIDWPNWAEASLWAITVAVFVYFGTHWTAKINRFFMFGLFICYFLMVGWTLPHADFQWLGSTKINFTGSFLALTVVVTSFGFHVLIPTLREYLNSDVDILVPTLIKGSTLPLLIYFLWTLAILAIVPQEVLVNISNGHLGTQAIIAGVVTSTGQHWLGVVGSLFLFFAVASSFMGIALALFDFIADSFQINKSRWGKVKVGLLTFLPPLFYAFLWPNGFMLALRNAGIFVALLHGILPVCMAFLGRKQHAKSYQAPGGNIALLITLLFFIGVMLSQLVIV